MVAGPTSPPGLCDLVWGCSGMCPSPKALPWSELLQELPPGDLLQRVSQPREEEDERRKSHPGDAVVH